MTLSLLAISVGASCGAITRWLLGLWLNPLLAHLPLGTLAANLVGGYAVGVAVAFFADASGLAPEWRLLVITGFLGGLTTFSTFSAEVIALLQQGRVGWGAAVVTAHLLGSVLLTVAGIATYAWLKG